MKIGCTRWALLTLVFLGISPSLLAQTAIPLAELKERRAALREKIGDGLVFLFGNTEGPGSESYFVFRQESNFYYLSGWTAPGAALLVAPDASARQSSGDALPTEILFLPPRNPSEEVWTGPQPDPKDPATAARAGFETIREITALDAELRRYSKAYERVYTLLPNPHASEAEQAVERERLERLKKLVPGGDFQDARPELRAMRQIKSASEIELIRRAVDCSIDAHLAAGRAIRPGLAEYEIGALMKYTFERAGCTNTAFDPIIGAGPRSTILHYTNNTGRLESGDLVVLDVGAEYGDYSADISRTLPVSGQFSARQKEIYEVVLGAQEAVIAAVRPGMTLYGRGSKSLHQVAREYLNTHGKDKHGNPLGKYFLHGIGHTIGLDVHDLSESSPVLQEGMVLALEPGLYLPEENIGVRIEDNVLVTKDGFELLTSRLPREPEEVEQWMRERETNNQLSQ
ncbi:MAG: aminopeptidase P family protein [Acidobacteria bacterium]|nr:aminopeptidase P family protein [Acidobacteriota bacterium]